MKKLMLLIVFILSILIQPTYAAEKKKVRDYKKPDWELVHHDVCLYTLTPDELFLYKEYYPLLDGETKTVSPDTRIDINVPYDITKELYIKIFRDDIVFYENTIKITDDGDLYLPTLSSDLFSGDVTFLLDILYNDDKKEENKFYFKKEDEYADLDIENLKIITSTNGIVIVGDIVDFQKLLNPKKISVRSSSGKECHSDFYDTIWMTDNYIAIPFISDDLDREYTLTIPEGCILLENGLNNKFVTTLHNEIKYVVPKNYLIRITPGDGEIKYIDGEEATINIEMIIDKNFKIDDTKHIEFNQTYKDLTITQTDEGTKLTFSADVKAEESYKIFPEDGLIIAQNGEINVKDSYRFTVIDINTIDLPQNAIFTDVYKTDWPYKYITELASKNIISGYVDKTFKPNNNITRAELAKILSVAFKIPEKNSEFYDAKSHWANGYIGSVENFVPVLENEFKPDNFATREEVAVSLVNVLEYITSSKLVDEKLEFYDQQIITKEYLTHISKATSAKLIFGYEDGTFRPKDNVTRAEITALIYRALEL